MPFITVSGTSDETTQDELQRLMEAVHKKAKDVSGIDYGPVELMVWFPADRMGLGLGEEFSIDVAGLRQGTFRDHPGSMHVLSYRQKRHSDKIAEKFCQLIATFFPAYKCIQCEVRPFEEHKGGYFVLQARK